MQATYFWNKFAVHRHKIILTVLGCLMALLAEAQSYKWARQNNPNYDERRKISYGFMIGLHTSAYQIKYSDKFVSHDFDTVHSVMTPFSGGFSLGFLVNLHVNDVFDLRLMPKAGFYDHKIEYYYTDQTKKEQFIETVLMEFPVLAKYKSARRGNVRMYVVGGVTPGFELSGKNAAQSASANIDIKNSNFSLDTGIGFDFYFPLFKFSQEIRFSKGVSNMLGPNPSIYKDPLKRLNTNTISVYLIFQ
jgi:Outer membrane protein beta-barrel domain